MWSQLVNHTHLEGNNQSSAVDQKPHKASFPHLAELSSFYMHHKILKASMNGPRTLPSFSLPKMNGTLGQLSCASPTQCWFSVHGCMWRYAMTKHLKNVLHNQPIPYIANENQILHRFS